MTKHKIKRRKDKHYIYTNTTMNMVKLETEQHLGMISGASER